MGSQGGLHASLYYAMSFCGPQRLLGVSDLWFCIRASISQHLAVSLAGMCQGANRLLYVAAWETLLLAVAVLCATPVRPFQVGLSLSGTATVRRPGAGDQHIWQSSWSNRRVRGFVDKADKPYGL